MARDMENKKKLDASYRPLCKLYRAKIRKDSGIMDALDRIKEKTGQGYATYAKKALRKKLIRDGYLSADSETDKE